MSEHSVRQPHGELPDKARDSIPPDRVIRRSSLADPSRQRPFRALRTEISAWKALCYGILCVAMCGGLWWWVTRGEPADRIVSNSVLPSPRETFADLPDLCFGNMPEAEGSRDWRRLFWNDLTRNTYATLRRVTLGFALAALIGVPLGVLCGCFRWLNAFFQPLTIFGRNIPIAALIPLTFALFGIDERQKVMFIFIACVAFVVGNSAAAIEDVRSQYVDTAYTLGAKRRQIILKVLVPLAMPSIFNSLRLLFGLAFGYIMLAELIKAGADASGGLGQIIMIAQRRMLMTHIVLVLLIIPILAWAIDRLLYWIQCQLFPYQYGGSGLFYRGLKVLLHGWEDLKGLVLPGPRAAGEARQ